MRGPERVARCAIEPMDGIRPERRDPGAGRDGGPPTSRIERAPATPLIEPVQAGSALGRERLARPVRSATRGRDRDAIPHDRSGERVSEERTGRAGPATTMRLAGRGHGPSAVVAVIGLFLAVAWIKPWPVAAPAPPRGAAAPTIAPTSTPDPLSNLKYHCQEPSGWRVYARERWGGRLLRSWRTLDPARAATGPLDPAIPVVPLGASISSLGYCSPWNTLERPPAGAVVEVWRLTPAAGPAAGWSASQVRPGTSEPAPATILAGLFGPPAGSGGSERAASISWTTGRWVFAIRASGFERWWAIDIQPPALPSGQPPAG